MVLLALVFTRFGHGNNRITIAALMAGAGALTHKLRAAISDRTIARLHHSTSASDWRLPGFESSPIAAPIPRHIGLQDQNRRCRLWLERQTGRFYDFSLNSSSPIGSPWLRRSNGLMFTFYDHCEFPLKLTPRVLDITFWLINTLLLN